MARSTVGVVLVAAGKGRRFDPEARRPKQFLPLAGRPLLWWPLDVFERTPAVSRVAVVLPGDSLAWGRRALRRWGFRKVTAVVAGGAERADSVRAGVSALPPETDVLLVHDAARALVERPVVERVIEATRRAGAALAAWPVPDTVKMSDGDVAHPRVRRTVSRRDLWLAQTPQGFRRDVAAKVFRRRGRAVTDDVQWAERLGVPVALVLGSPRNFKVTHPEDLELCRAIVG
jgi:2-C-methyl-D-erythritol 4-phosphate cytidylyltransferase